jgi:hypothetical protein
MVPEKVVMMVDCWDENWVALKAEKMATMMVGKMVSLTADGWVEDLVVTTVAEKVADWAADLVFSMAEW